MISIVTTNNDKYDEISNVLNEYGIKTKQHIIELEENEENMEKIVKSKSKQAFSILKKPLIVDDTGIFFEAYENFPGHRSKRIYQEIGLNGILEKLKGKKRNAFFKSIICYIDKNNFKMFEGKLKGHIVNSIQGVSRKKFPYDKIFIPNNFSKVLSKISWEQRLKLSHRSKAVKMFAEWFTKINKMKHSKGN